MAVNLSSTLNEEATALAMKGDILLNQGNAQEALEGTMAASLDYFLVLNTFMHKLTYQISKEHHKLNLTIFRSMIDW